MGFKSCGYERRGNINVLSLHHEHGIDIPDAVDLYDRSRERDGRFIRGEKA